MKLLVVAILLLAVIPVSALLARNRIVEDGPDPLSATRSLRDVIKGAPNKQVHIVFIHGMRAEGPNESAALRQALAKRLGARGGEHRLSRNVFDLGPWPSGAKVGAGQPGPLPGWTPGDPQIWKSDEEWKASRPFVDRYVLHLPDGETITLDEVNWWPLLFPIKCRFVLVPEHHLAGRDKKHLKLCASEAEPFHPWLTQTQLGMILGTRPRSGGAAWANGWGKREILNWGLADAVIALGPMRHYLAEAMEKAFEYAEAAPGGGEPVLVSESLGSFVVLDSYELGRPAVTAFLERTHNLYFFANQFALLELARIQGVPATVAESLSVGVDRALAQAVSPLEALSAWGRASPSPDRTGLVAEAASLPKQVIAISDPSDLLTYRVPDLPNVTVVNIYTRNATNYGLFANPLKAHVGHAANPSVWKILLR